MSIQLVLMLLAFSGLAGIALGYVLRMLIALSQRGSLELEVKQKMIEARERASRLIAEAEARAEEVEAEKLAPLTEREERMEEREERMGKREEFLDERERHLSDESESVKTRENEVANLKREADTIIKERRQELSRIANLSEAKAKEMLLKDLEDSGSESILARLQKLEAHGREQLEGKARSILLSSIHRMAGAVNAEVMSLSVSIPSEEVKGKIIGKEGRNIKAFERATGVDVIIDEAPDKISLSSFDPLRTLLLMGAFSQPKLRKWWRKQRQR
jgi:ribonucrease Y